MYTHSPQFALRELAVKRAALLASGAAKCYAANPWGETEHLRPLAETLIGKRDNVTLTVRDLLRAIMSERALTSFNRAVASPFWFWKVLELTIEACGADLQLEQRDIAAGIALARQQIRDRKTGAATILEALSINPMTDLSEAGLSGKSELDTFYAWSGGDYRVLFAALPVYERVSGNDHLSTVAGAKLIRPFSPIALAEAVAEGVLLVLRSQGTDASSLVVNPVFNDHITATGILECL